MNPRELSARFLLQSRCLLGLSVLLFLVSTPPQLGKMLKALACGSASVTLGAAWVQRRQHQRFEPMAGVYSKHELQAFGQFLQTQSEMSLAAVSGMWETVQTQVLAPGEQALLPAQTFDWGRFNSEPDQFAHLAIVGPTGSGKSTLAEALATQLGGITLAIAPHRKPGDFKALGNRVYCGGRNYQGGNSVEFQQLLDGTAGEVSVTAVISCVYDEMDRRYKLLDAGEDTGPFVNVIWDETLAALDEAGKILVPLMLKLLREARKIGIRLILLPQDDQVKSLHLDGQGAARANLSYVRLGKLAIAHAKSLEKTQKGTFAQVSAQRRPCLVESEPAIVPEYNSTLVTNMNPSYDECPEPRYATYPEWDEIFQLTEPTVVGRERDEELLTIIQKFGEGKDVVTPSQLKSNRNALRKLPTDAIALLLGKLDSRGIGEVVGEPGALKWHPPTNSDNPNNDAGQRP